mgnify:CR=1 FL=1
MFRGILIDPFVRTVTEVRVGGDYTDIYNHLTGVVGPPVEIFTIGHYFENGDIVFVDDEGLLKAGNKLFFIDRMLAGRGLILGRSSDARSGLVDIQNMVKWSDMVTA